MESKLEQLKAMTVVVADTGDVEAIKQYHPIDATTNPSLLLKAAAIPEYEPLISKAISMVPPASKFIASDAADQLGVLVGKEILSIVPGKVSTEVDARLSFDVNRTIEKARKLIQLYENEGITRERILIKIASTWEGITAAQQLEKEGIQCNLTLLFSFAQAIACADAHVHLISPFVGRILDWYKSNNDQQDYSGENDPGVHSVTQIYNYYKTFDYQTIVMGASFRSTEEIEHLAGCDKLTISPQLMEALNQDSSPLQRRLSPSQQSDQLEKITLDEQHFRWMMNEDAMATEKLAEGIRKFSEDQAKLESLLQNRL